MNWAEELFEKIQRKHIVSELEHEGYLKESDLVSVVCKQGDELQEIVSKFLHGRTHKELQALSFFEMSYKAELWDDLLKKARELKK